MLLTSFEILESLYSDLNDFNIEVKNIQEENEYCFENKYDKNCKIYVEIVYAYSNHLLIKDFFIKDKNGNFCNYKNLPAILKFKFFSNEFEEFRANKNGTFKIKYYRFSFSNIDKMKVKKKLYKEITGFMRKSEYGTDYIEYVGDADDIYCKIYENYKLIEIKRCCNGRVGHPTKPAQVFFNNRGKVIKEIYKNPSTGLIEKVDGPAIITYNKIGKIQSRGYYLKGNKVTNPLELAILKSLS